MSKGAPRYNEGDISCVVNALEKGATFSAACRAAGLSPSGMRDHMAKHPEVKERIDVGRNLARREVETALYDAATKPDKHGKRDVRAAEVWLTNQFPQEWKNRRDLSITTTPENSDEIRRRREELSPEAVRELQELAHKEILRQGKQEAEGKKLH